MRYLPDDDLPMSETEVTYRRWLFEAEADGRAYMDPETGRVWTWERIVGMKNVCPECKAGAHGNCDGGAWDDETDAPTVCDCYALGHPDGK